MVIGGTQYSSAARTRRRLPRPSPSRPPAGPPTPRHWRAGGPRSVGACPSPAARRRPTRQDARRSDAERQDDRRRVGLGRATARSAERAGGAHRPPESRRSRTRWRTRAAAAARLLAAQGRLAPVNIGFRVDYPSAAISGEAACEYGSTKAAKEINELADCVKKYLVKK